MSDNFAIRDFITNLSKVFRSTDVSGVHVPHHIAYAGENHTGSVGRDGDIISVTLSVDTAGSYAADDLLADTQVITDGVRVAGGRATLQSLVLLDEEDQSIAVDLVFLSANNSLGTENSAVTVSDVFARDILGHVSISSADYIDLGGSRIATKTNIGLLLEAASASTSLYIAAIIRGSATYTVSTSVKLRLGFIWD